VGRPLKNNILYFAHDADAWRHFKFQALRAHYGPEKGWAMEGRFWALNCMIATADGCRLDIKKAFTRCGIAQNLSLSLEEFDEFIAFLSDYEACGLIQKEGDTVSTERCDDELGHFNKSRNRERDRKQMDISQSDMQKPDFCAQDTHRNGVSAHSLCPEKGFSGKGLEGLQGIREEKKDSARILARARKGRESPPFFGFALRTPKRNNAARRSVAKS
jgi:hypothetical protein